MQLLVAHCAQTPRIGYTDEQQAFVVPPTVDVVRALYPRNWTPTILLILLSLGVQLWLTIADVVPVEAHIAWVVFWRLMYNVGLGALLHFQSNYRSLTKLYAYHTENKTCFGAILRRLAASGYRENAAAQAASPACLNAWFAYRQIVDVILFHDSFGFMFLCGKMMHWPSLNELQNPWLLARFAAGLVLFRFNYWAKVDAHRCIGDWAWYWEDFFYRCVCISVFFRHHEIF